MTTIIEDVKLDFCDVLLMPKRSSLDSRSKVDLTRAFKFKHSPVQYNGTPLIVANMDVTGTIEMAKALKPFNMAVALHKFYDLETIFKYFNSSEVNPHTFYSMGITDADYEKFQKVETNLRIALKPLQYVCIDVANGYSRKFVNFVEKMRLNYPDVVIMAGNVVTPDMVYDLLERGADIVKVGIGSGSVCTTRRVTGVGFPQLSAIMECQDAAHGADGLICGDGGITTPGDFSKAFAAGSDFAMSGGMFAGHTECGGEIVGLVRRLKDLQWDASLDSKLMTYVEIYGNEGGQYVVNVGKLRDFIRAFSHDSNMKVPEEFKFAVEEIIPDDAKMRFYGMSSHEAMDKHYGGKANYRASEGKVVEVPYKGTVTATVEEILGGIRSACTYIGARRLKDMPKCATFVRVNRVLNESLSQYNV